MEKIRILLVDDDRQNSEFLRKFLEVEGYEVAYAENGRKGCLFVRKTEACLSSS